MKKAKDVFSAVCAPVLAWLFPVIFLYARNVKEVKITETFEPAGIFLLCAAAALLIGLLLFRDLKVGAFFSVLNGVILGNFGYLLDFIQRIMPTVRYWHLLYLVIVLEVVVCYAMHKWNLVGDGLFVAKIVFGGLILFNLVTAAPTMIQRISDIRSTSAETAVEGTYQAGKRNIYYLLCDEYASFAQLEHDFGYDNSPFREELEELGFNVSESSRNDSTSTKVVMANVMQLDYAATSEDTAARLEGLAQNGIVHVLLKQNGYSLRGVGNTNWMGFESALKTDGKSGTADGTSLQELCVSGSFLGAIVKRNYTEDAQMTVSSFDALCNMEIVPDSSVFTMFYVSAPHHPYYFDENGNLNPSSKWANDSSGKNNDAYLGMLRYVNKEILTAVERIVALDPNAIIILCSDHGNRFGTVSGEFPYRILNALYYGGEAIEEFEGLSSVNTLRYIFNREFAMEMEYIDLPE